MHLKGNTTYINAKTKDDLKLAYELVDSIRENGYKNEIVIASDEKLSQEELSGYMFYEDCMLTWNPNYISDKSVANYVENTADVIDELTIYAAEFLGERDNLGSIEVGKLADLSIFSENLLELPLKKLENVHSDMTVLDGVIVHDVESENEEELYNMMLETQM